MNDDLKGTRFDNSSSDRFTPSYSNVDDTLERESVGIEEVSSFERGRQEETRRKTRGLRERGEESC